MCLRSKFEIDACSAQAEMVKAAPLRFFGRFSHRHIDADGAFDAGCCARIPCSTGELDEQEHGARVDCDLSLG